jgi:hypothetical protein
MVEYKELHVLRTSPYSGIKEDIQLVEHLVAYLVAHLVAHLERLVAYLVASLEHLEHLEHLEAHSLILAYYDT